LLKRIPLAIAALALVLLPGATNVGASAPATHFVAHLTAAQEVFPSVTSAATGTLDLRLVAGGTKLRFKLSSNGVDQITQSHIHVTAAAGTNGPVVVYFFAPPKDPWNSVTGDNFSVSGVRTAADVHLPGATTPFTFADLVAALRGGTAYVNIHSIAHPGGEIRGQILPVGDGEEN
jgi:hypothetical protein